MGPLSDFYTISILPYVHDFCLPHIHVDAETITSFALKSTAQMTKLAALYAMKVGTNLHNPATNETKRDHNLYFRLLMAAASFQGNLTSQKDAFCRR